MKSGSSGNSHMRFGQPVLGSSDRKHGPVKVTVFNKDGRPIDQYEEQRPPQEHGEERRPFRR